ncbi:MAG TPA: hypothetical protein VGD66_13280 [Allosphingosinicella sp.]
MLPILLLLSACGAQPEAGNDAAAAPAGAQDPLANLQLADPAAEAARLQALVAQAMPAALRDAKDARYRNVRAGAGGSACGEVAAKGSGVFRPFVVTPEGVAVVGETPHIAFEDPTDFLADAYIRWCASPEELERVAPEIRRAGAGAAALNQVDAAAPPPLMPPETATPEAPPPKAAPARPAAPPPPPQIDSFFNSVQHKDP